MLGEGDDQNRTGVDGFAGRCLTTRPRRLGRQCSDGPRPGRPSTSGAAMPRISHGRRRRLQSQGRRRQDDDGRQCRRPRSPSPVSARCSSISIRRAPRAASLGMDVDGRPRLERAVRGQGQARRRRTRSQPALFRLGVVRRGPGARRGGGRAARRRRRRARLLAGCDRSREHWAVDGHRHAARARAGCPTRRCGPPTPCWCRSPPTSSRSTRCAVDAGRRARASRSRAAAPTARSPCCRRSSTGAAPARGPRRRCCSEQFATWCWPAAIPVSARFDSAALAGVPVVVSAPGSTASQAYRVRGARAAGAPRHPHATPSART